MANSTPVEQIDRPNAGVLAEAERLKREHNELKARLTKLNARVYLTPAEEMEKKQIQKLKLLKKDQLTFLEVSYSGNS